MSEAATTYHELEITVRIVTDRPWEPHGITDVASEITVGEFVGVWTITKNEEITAKHAAELLLEFGSDPGFFCLDDEGDDDDPEAEEALDAPPECPPTPSKG